MVSASGTSSLHLLVLRQMKREERVNVDYEDLPPVLVQAVLSAEDRKFFDHSGIDPIGIGRAFYQSVLGDSQSQQGGSTITQQYVKLTYLTSERSLERKLKEDPPKLSDLAAEYGISRERVRQLEARALGKLRTAMRKAAAEAGLMQQQAAEAAD